MCHPETFWEHYRLLEPDRRHYYEVVPQGHPCRPYFDLEFMREANRDKDGDAMVGRLIEELCVEFSRLFGVSVSGGDFLRLDSTTDAKYSCHLIVNHPRLVFADNRSLGGFVKSFCRQHDGKEIFLARNAEGDKKLFVDEGVYTKNRNFRLYLSSKYGKPAVLKVAESDLYTVQLTEARPDSSQRQLDKLIFLDSLVTRVGELSQDDMIRIEVPVPRSQGSTEGVSSSGEVHLSFLYYRLGVQPGRSPEGADKN